MGGGVCSDFSIDPSDFDPSNRKLELQLTSFGDRFRDIVTLICKPKSANDPASLHVQQLGRPVHAAEV